MVGGVERLHFLLGWRYEDRNVSAQLTIVTWPPHVGHPNFSSLLSIAGRNLPRRRAARHPAPAAFLSRAAVFPPPQRLAPPPEHLPSASAALTPGSSPPRLAPPLPRAWPLPELCPRAELGRRRSSAYVPSSTRSARAPPLTPAGAPPPRRAPPAPPEHLLPRPPKLRLRLRAKLRPHAELECRRSSASAPRSARARPTVPPSSTLELQSVSGK